MTPKLTIVATLLVVFFPSIAAAHLELVEPPNRYGQLTQKYGPCGKGDGARSDNVTVFEAGETITVRWTEFIDHPGHFRISFDADGQDDFVDPPCLSGCDTRQPTIEEYSNDAVLLDGIADKRGGAYEVEVELPDITCDNCTLQVMQVMYEKAPYELPGDDLYFNCADLEIVAGGEGDAGDAGAGADASLSDRSDVSRPIVGAPSERDSAGCVIAGTAGDREPLEVLGLLAVAVALVRRRR